MKKVSLIPVTVLMVALLFVLISVVSAQSDQSALIECTIDIVIDFWEEGMDPYWRGPVTGCSLGGTVEFREDRPLAPNGSMAHFYERFTFYPESGGSFTGYNNGIWNFVNFNFRAQGFVTGASEEWSHLVGAKYFEKGTTSDPGPEFDLPIYALGTHMTIAPAK